jgi:hypothetical protein
VGDFPFTVENSLQATAGIVAIAIIVTCICCIISYRKRKEIAYTGRRLSESLRMSLKRKKVDPLAEESDVFSENHLSNHPMMMLKDDKLDTIDRRSGVAGNLMNESELVASTEDLVGNVAPVEDNKFSLPDIAGKLPDISGKARVK